MDHFAKCPQRVKIVGKNYSVVVVDKVDEEDSLGDSDEPSQQITIRRCQHFEAAKDTVLHEIVHAIDHAMGMDLAEQQVVGIAAGVLQVLRENPKLARFLLEKSPKPKR